MLTHFNSRFIPEVMGGTLSLLSLTIMLTYDIIALSFSKLELSQASIKANLLILGTLTYKDLLYLCD